MPPPGPWQAAPCPPCPGVPAAEEQTRGMPGEASRRWPPAWTPVHGGRSTCGAGLMAMGLPWQHPFAPSAPAPAA
eukprot:1162126-Pelagomonas_calceolata.AAC.6